MLEKYRDTGKVRRWEVTRKMQTKQLLLSPIKRYIESFKLRMLYICYIFVHFSPWTRILLKISLVFSSSAIFACNTVQSFVPLQLQNRRACEINRTTWRGYRRGVSLHTINFNQVSLLLQVTRNRGEEEWSMP